MTDWKKVEKVGSDLRTYWLDMHRRAREGLPERLAKQVAQLDEMNPLGAAIRRHYEGDKDAVAEYVRTYRLCDDEQLQLAEFLKGKLAPPKPKRGQPPGNALGATGIAEQFYTEWRDWNARCGVRDHGHCERMREEAVRFVCEDFLSPVYGVSGEAQREIVLANMNRPRARRKIRH